MLKYKFITSAMLSGLLLSQTGCENLPGNKGTQGAVIGGASGAAVGAAVGGKDNRVLGAVLGGVLGAGGGYVIGANVDRVRNKDSNAAEEAAQTSQSDPATAEDALKATTADLNTDGFVTLDEVVAMEEAGLTDEQMIERMRSTNQVFELTDDQKKYLTDRGVSTYVVAQMGGINQQERERLLNDQSVISREPSPGL